MHLREKYFEIVGGRPVIQEGGDKIGANGYGKSAVNAVETVKNLLRQKG